MEYERDTDEMRRLIGQYHSPPDTPREEMWARIDAARRRDYHVTRSLRRTLPRPLWGIGIAALLVIGFSVGRLSIRTTPVDTPPPLAADPGPTPEPGLAYRVATAAHLSRAEVFLTSFRVARQGGGTDARVAEWARELLVGTHLLLDSPAADDPRTRQLLEDLELILVQIARLDREYRPVELDLVEQAIEARDVLPRIRTAIPAGPIPAGT